MEKQDILIINYLNIKNQTEINQHLTNNNYKYIFINKLELDNIIKPFEIPIFCSKVFVFYCKFDTIETLNKYFKIPFDCKLIYNYFDIKTTIYSSCQELHDINKLIPNFKLDDYNIMVYCYCKKIKKNSFFNTLYIPWLILKTENKIKKYKIFKFRDNKIYYSILNF
jgi:hypothetical protein